MTHRSPLKPLKTASILLGAFFCLLATACSEKKQVTSDWEQQDSPGQTEASESAATTSARQAELVTTEEADRPAEKVASASAPQGKEIRFLSYNLKNYLTMRRYIDGEAVYTGKPEEEITALIDIVKGARPDVLGICEIGSAKDLKDFQNRLKAAGVDLPHTHRVSGMDEVRALAILSKYPIVSTATPKKLGYTVNGVEFSVSRGILDATVQLPSRKVRFFGVHFKSKRPIKEADQELMRRSESLLLRQHINDILAEAPDTNIMAYGDFNDTKRTKAVYTVRGRSNSKSRLEMIEAADSRGHLWTHHWAREDIYSRFDFAMASLSLLPHVNLEGCKLLDPENWETASDHRALLVLIK